MMSSGYKKPESEDSQSQDLLSSLMNHLDLYLSTKDEYFLAIAKRKGHIFLMLGVVHQDTPVILTRVGKTPIFANSSCIKINYDWILGDGIPARIQFEPTGQNFTKSKAISYQAYSITLKQLREFLHLLYDIEQAVLSDGWKKRMIEKDRRKNPVLQSYVPIKSQDDQLTFCWISLQQGDFKKPHEKDFSQVIDDAQTMQLMNNNCLKTVVDILDALLGVATDISKNCFASFAYETTWSSPGKLDQETFYIWPVPPPKEGPEESKTFTPDQLRTLHILYARLQEIPKLNPRSKKTRNKFNAVKEMYIEIAGTENLDVPALLNRISEHENKNNNLTALYQNRGLFSFTTTTKKMMDNIKSDLENKSRMVTV